MENCVTPPYRNCCLVKKGNALLLPAVFLLLTFAAPANALAGFAIALKNGSTFITDWYWESGGLIRFHAFGGVVGFDRGAVRSIKETTKEIDPQHMLPRDAGPEKPGIKRVGTKTAPRTPTQAQLPADVVPTGPLPSPDPNPVAAGTNPKIKQDIEMRLERLKKKSDQAWTRLENLPETVTKTEKRAARKRALTIDSKIAELTRKLRQL